MDILFAVIGVLVGGSLGYWWRGRTIDRPLPSSAVWLFPVKGTEGLWRVGIQKKHNWMEPEPTLWTLPQHEHSFALQKNTLCIVKTVSLSIYGVYFRSPQNEMHRHWKPS